MIYDAVRALGFNPVTLAIFNREFPQDNVVRRHQKPFSGPLLPRKIKRGLKPALPFDRDAVNVERQAVRKNEPARGQFDNIAGFSSDESLLQPPLRAIPRRDQNDLRLKRLNVRA